MAYTMGFITLYPQWAELFRAFRKYLGHPSNGKTDVLKYHMDGGDLPESSMRFLAEIVISA